MAIRVSQIVDKQIKAWNHRNEKLLSRDREKVHYPVITISREFGALGAALATKLGELTTFEVWDKELMEAIAEDLDSDIKLLETLDERRQQDIEDAVSGFMSNIRTNVNYIKSLLRVVRTIEEHGRSIIVGRGANYICEKENSFHIRVVSPFKTRVSQYAKKNKMQESKSRKLIEQKDQERAEFIKRYFYRDHSTPSDYALIINSGNFTLGQMADLVLDAYEMKIGHKLELVKK
ncbi:cytidylate kinase-like family protein [soil metagenome]